MQLKGPPPTPADVTSQQGEPMPFAGVGEQMASEQKAPNPQGALQARADAVKKVLQSMTEEAKAGKNFFSRAMELIDKGLQAEAGGGQAASGPPEPAGKPEGGTPQNLAFPG